MRAILFFSVIVLLCAIAYAVPVKMTAPLQQEIGDGDIVYIGAIGPGQTIDVRIDPIVTTGGINKKGGQYDYATVTKNPSGWSFEPSQQYGKPLQVKITADKNAPEGLYSTNVTVIDENNGEELGNVTFTIKTNITWDVLDMNVSPTHATVGPGQPARFSITITNKGSASDQFVVSATGAKRWQFVKPIYVPAKSSRTIVYEITAYEEEYYTPTIKVESVASSNIHEEKNVSFTVRSDLLGDYRATNQGISLFPIIEAPIYSLAGLVAAVLGSFGF
jgi:hypothetical protein